MKARPKTSKIGAMLQEPEVYVPQQATEEEIATEEAPILNPLLEELEALHNFLKEFDANAPMVSVLEAWKGRYVNIYVSKVVDESKYYIWRTMTRVEYKRHLNSKALDDETNAQDVIVEQCLLYPLPDQVWRMKSDAGVITTLSKQISYQSGFISPQEALAFIRVV